MRTDHVANACEPATECPELPRVHALADGELHACEAARVRRHVVRCQQCRSELAFVKQLAVAVARGLLAEVIGGIRAIGGIEAIDRLS